MGLWSHVRKLWSRAANTKSVPRVHDFTFSFTGNSVTRVKSLQGDRAFLTGEAAGIRPGDAIVVRPNSTANCVWYRVETAQCRPDGTFRAYARVERLHPVRTPARVFSDNRVRWVPVKGS